MSDFTLSVDFDARQVLQGFAKLEQDAKRAGDSAGKSLAEGLQGFSSKSIAALQQELNRLQQRQLKVDVDSRAFTVTGEKIRAVQAQLDAIQRKQVAIGVDSRSIVALQSKLQELQARQIKVDVDSSEFIDLQRQINATQAELTAVERRRINIDVNANSISAITSRLQADLDRLQQRQLKVDVDSSEFAALGREIDRVQSELQQVERRRVMVNVDANSITALNAKLGDLQQELNRVAIGSQRFRELQGAIQDTERELAKAGESTDKFRLLDGVIQGVAFSLSNAVVNAAGQALSAVGGLIGGYARLDTEIRKAAAAGGEAGGYDKLAGAIDRVGIEAAGTQQQVAELTTELVRGGLTVDQTTQALGAIVRGAEATGTAYANMGSVVTAALKGFGLQANDAGRVVDALVTGANASATSVEGMGNAFKYAAPVAKILGISVEDLGIAVGLLTNAGITAEEAGVTLRNGLSKLASAAPQAAGATQKLTGQAKMAADAMKSLGIDIYNADGTIKPMEQTLLTLKGAFDKLGPSSKIRIAANLFGGEDDGTKWLALLNQSESEIRKMAATMANTKGATDVARDAMQGFQLTAAQLTGTLDSLGNNVGRIAAGALLPLANAANAVVGAVAGLPGPVKDTAIALGLLTGAVVGATSAYVIFQRVMQADMTQKAIAGIVDLARAIGTTLAAGVTSAAAVIPGLLTQLQLIGQVKAGAAISAIGTALKAGFLTSLDAAIQSLAKFVGWLTTTSFGSFVAGIRSVVVAIAPLALAVGAVTAAVVVWQKVLEGAGQASEEFAGSQKAVADALAKLGTDLNKTAEDARNANRGFLGLGEVFRNAKEGWTLIRLVQETEKLDKGFDQVYNSAMKFAQELRNTTNVTDEQKKKAQEYIAQLQAVSVAYRAQAERAKSLAVSEAQLGNKDTANYYQSLSVKLGANANAMSNLVASFQRSIGVQAAATAATGQQTQATEEQTKATKARAEAEAELSKIIAEAPVRQLDAQLAVGQQLLSLAQAIGQAEQSRFAVTRSALEFELQQAEKRGASEQQLKSLRDQIAINDRAALQARFQALQNEQQLQGAMLQLTQEKARTEANLAVLQQRAELLKAQAELQTALQGGDQLAIDAAQAQVNLQQEILGVQQSKVGLLAQTQPLEAAALGYQQEAARNGLQAEAAAKGYRIALDGTLQPANKLVELQGRIGTITNASAEDQRRYADLAAQSGIAIGKAADGTLVLGRTQQDVNAAVDEMNRQLAGAKGGFDAAGKGAAATRGAVDGIRTGLGNAQNPANALAGAFVTTGDKAPAIAQSSRDFAGWLSKAGGYTNDIARLGLDRQMKLVASSTGDAATQAQSFYNWLKQASNLPGSRWTGGPVEAGGEYKINELGQEAFLSAGRLSMINAPANSIWRAPSDGVVIPAGITAQLQARAAVQATGGGPGGVAELAIEVGKLRQEVGNLARRDWSVKVTQRTGPTGSQVMRTLLS